MTPAPTPGPFCAQFTADELSSALGVPVTPIRWFGSLSCTWQADPTSGASVSLDVRVDGGTIADTVKVAHPGGTDVPVGGTTAYYVPDITTLWLETGDSLLAFELDGSPAAGIDAQTALTALAETALGGIDATSMPIDGPEPQPSFVGDQDLVDLFPDEVVGQKVEVLSVTGQELLGTADEATIRQITDALTPLGKTIDDLSLGIANVFVAPGGALIVALRVRGADATTFGPLVLPLFESEFLDSFSDPTQTPTQIAGRDVVMVTDGPPSDTGDKAYVYAKNDVVWLVAVIGTGLAIEDVLGTLP